MDYIKSLENAFDNTLESSVEMRVDGPVFSWGEPLTNDTAGDRFFSVDAHVMTISDLKSKLE